jgi:hypothetical protein
MSEKLTIREFRPFRRNKLYGYAVCTIAELRPEIRDIAIHEKNGKRWAQLPAKPQVRDGVLVKGDGGKEQYTPVMAFVNRTVADAFSTTVIRAVLEAFPQAFDAEDAA